MKTEYDFYAVDYSTENEEEVVQEIGCGFCWDKRKSENIELWFIDRANNMRLCSYCPSCGRKYEEE